jgi:PST family polysaccharide transporter
VSGQNVITQARSGALSLLARQIILFPVSFLTGILLARLLTPTDFGTYATVSFVVMAIGSLLEGGFGSVLIQQTEEPTPEQLRSVFTSYLVAFGSLTVLMIALAPWLAGLFHLDAVHGPWLLRVMSLHMIMGVFGSISTFLLERHMRFQVFTRLDVVNVLLDRGVTLALAFAGFGAWSFVIGSLVSSAVRFVLLVRAAPWPFGLAFDHVILKRFLSTGLYFQGVNMTNIARENLTPILGGGLFGPQQVGYLNWGQNLPQTASNSFMVIATRVCFPAFSRLHDDKEARERLFHQALRGLNFVTLPALALIVATGPQIVTYVYTEPWRPGLAALACFAVRMAFKNPICLMLEYLNARGRVKENFRVTTVWTIVEWAIALSLIPFFGFNGIAGAYALGPVVPLVWLAWLVRTELTLPIIRAFVLPVLTAAAGVTVAIALLPWVAHSWELIAVLAFGLAIAYAIAAVIERELLMAAWRYYRTRKSPPEPPEPPVPTPAETI